MVKSFATIHARTIHPGEFEANNHWYPKALNATIHPMVNFFLNLDQERVISRYCHLHPLVNPANLRDILNYQCKYFLWAGADLLNVTSASGKRQMVVIENNSCPSGQKSMPLMEDHQEQGNYRLLIERTFKPQIEQKRTGAKGVLAVIYDKNPMEASGYAAALADVFNEPVYYASFYQTETSPAVRFEHDYLWILDEHGEWLQVRAAFRYVTQRPWNRLPLHCKTKIFNPIIACLAGGRNKMMAAKAYDLFNAELEESGLKINMPETIWDVTKDQVPLWVEKMGGQAVVKVPYSNAGQGVYTIVSSQELDAFMAFEFPYDRFIVQSLIGNYLWSSNSSKGRLYHVGTIPNTKGKTYVADLRMMVSTTASGIRPLCVYARRARLPLEDHIGEGSQSWDMLGTNLSIKLPNGEWGSDTDRLILMDRRDFNKLGIGVDDLIEAFIQTVLSMVAIDHMAKNLVNKQGHFKMRLFKSLNHDDALLNEIMS